MEPALRHGDRLIYARLRPRVRDIVVARDARDVAERWIVKRLVQTLPGRATLASDAPDHETVSIPLDAIVGRIVLRYAPLGRVGLVR